MIRANSEKQVTACGKRIEKIRSKFCNRGEGGFMTEIPQISDAEWAVMKILWNSSPASAGDIIARLEGSREWKPKTVKTLLSRLLNKGAIGYRMRERSYEYYPLVDREQCLLAESESFLQRVYNGNFNAMVSALIGARSLTDEQIASLKEILDGGGEER